MVVLNIFKRLKLFIVTVEKREYVVVQPSSNYMGSIFMPHLFSMKKLSQPVLALGPLKPVLSVVFNCNLRAHITVRFCKWQNNEFIRFIEEKKAEGN